MNVTNLGSFCLIFFYEKKNMRVKVFSQKNEQLFRHVEFFAWQARLLNVRCLATLIQEWLGPGAHQDDDGLLLGLKGTRKQKSINYNFIPQISEEKKRKYCEQSLFFFRFSKGTARARERWAPSRQAPSVTREVIYGSSAFCWTDQEKERLLIVYVQCERVFSPKALLQETK